MARLYLAAGFKGAPANGLDCCVWACRGPFHTLRSDAAPHAGIIDEPPFDRMAESFLAFLALAGLGRSFGCRRPQDRPKITDH